MTEISQDSTPPIPFDLDWKESCKLHLGEIYDPKELHSTLEHVEKSSHSERITFFDNHDPRKITASLLHPNVCLDTAALCLTYAELDSLNALLLLSNAHHGTRDPIIPNTEAHLDLYARLKVLLDNIGVDLIGTLTTFTPNQFMSIVESQYPGKSAMLYNFLLNTIKNALPYRDFLEARLELLSKISTINGIATVPLISIIKEKEQEFKSFIPKTSEINAWREAWKEHLTPQFNRYMEHHIRFPFCLSRIVSNQIEGRYNHITNNEVCAVLTLPVCRDSELITLSALRRLKPEHMGLIMSRGLASKNDKQEQLGSMIMNQIRLGASDSDILNGILLAAEFQNSRREKLHHTNDMNGSIRYINSHLR